MCIRITSKVLRRLRPLHDMFLMTSINLLCWNCRGAFNRTFPRLVQDMRKVHNIDVLVLLEPRCIGEKATKVIGKLGFDSSWRMEACGFSGGIWILWDSTHISIRPVSEMDQCVTIRLSRNEVDCVISCVYGSPRFAERDSLWSYLSSMHTLYKNTSWAWIGDYNSYLNADEKKGGIGPNLRSMERFRGCVDFCEFHDMGFAGPKFTWNNGSIWERLDRCLCNMAWLQNFNDSSIFHLNSMKSDHRPILLKINGGNVQRRPHNQRVFKFQLAWFTHQDFHPFVDSRWKQGDSWHLASSSFTEEVKLWNKNVFGNIFQKKQKILKRLEGVDRRLGDRVDSQLLLLHKDLWKEYENVLLEEEVFLELEG